MNPLNRLFCVVAAIAGVATAAAAGSPARALAWPTDVADRVRYVQLGGDGTLEIDAPDSADLSLIELEGPAISQPFFGLRMQIRHQDVAPDGAIQMDAAFGPGEVYFSRQPLAGTGPWRTLELPFNASQPNGAWRTPTALRLRVILPGGGRVGIAGPTLVQAASWGELARAAGAWWSASEAGWIGAVGGVLFGSLGALVGILVGRGRARNLALTLCWLAAALGCAALIAGLIAVAAGQDYVVYYPLLLIGGLGVVMFPLFALRSRRAYTGGELRRMRARDR